MDHRMPTHFFQPPVPPTLSLLVTPQQNRPLPQGDLTQYCFLGDYKLDLLALMSNTTREPWQFENMTLEDQKCAIKEVLSCVLPAYLGCLGERLARQPRGTGLQASLEGNGGRGPS